MIGLEGFIEWRDFDQAGFDDFDIEELIGPGGAILLGVIGDRGNRGNAVSTRANEWSITYKLQSGGEHPTQMHQDSLSQVDVLNLLALTVRPGLAMDARCTVTVCQGTTVRLVVDLYPEREEKT